LADGQTVTSNTAGEPGPEAPAREWDWNRLLTPRIVFLMLPVLGLLVVSYGYPLMRWEVMWRNEDEWSHGYLIPLLAVVIAHFRLKERVPSRMAPSMWGLPLILAGSVIRLWSRTMWFGYPGDVSFLLVVAGIVLLLLGWEVFKAVWVSVVYLGLMIPLSTKYYEGVALPLQRAAAIGAERILMLFRVLVARQGNVLHLASGQINVAEACSGLRLLMAFVALGVLMAYMYRRPLWERVVIMASSIPIAVFCNVIRVTLMGLASNWLHAEAGRVAQGAATWSVYAPDFTSWSGASWVGFVLLCGGVFFLVMRGGTGAVGRFLSSWRAAGLGVLGALVVALTSGLRIGYETPARLEEVRQVVLNPDSGPHQAFGFAMLGLAFVLMWAELGIIDLFFVEDEAGGRGGGEPADDAPAGGEPRPELSP